MVGEKHNRSAHEGVISLRVCLLAVKKVLNSPCWDLQTPWVPVLISRHLSKLHVCVVVVNYVSVSVTEVFVLSDVSSSSPGPAAALCDALRWIPVCGPLVSCRAPQRVLQHSEIRTQAPVQRRGKKEGTWTHRRRFTHLCHRDEQVKRSPDAKFPKERSDRQCEGKKSVFWALKRVNIFQ